MIRRPGSSGGESANAIVVVNTSDLVERDGGQAQTKRRSAAATG
ncbi:MAG TPA: hypothetical protein VGS17_00430 [Candidatus Limnocylindria bacterium]|nr:hypothetical protein [Candidatus Limnocylindria bacterium]